ncbi:MAG: Lrp/AsnC family transcriptional regulator [Pseudomonadota bacterium]
MDAQDTALLTHLQRDATLSHQTLAELTGMSTTTVWRRIQSLEASGILTARVALVDPEKAGLGTAVLTDVSLVEHSPETRAAFERIVRTRAEIQECYAVSGSHDYQLLIRVRDIAAYERFLMEALLGHPAVASANTSFVLRQLKFTTALPL